MDIQVEAKKLYKLAQAPLLQIFFDKNPLALFFGFVAPPMAFAKKYLPLERISTQLDADTKRAHHDVLDQYLLAHQAHPGVVTRDEIVDLGLMVVVPASEAV